MKQLTDDLLVFIDKAKSVYHASRQIQDKLDNVGFIKLDEKESWNLENGRSYYIERNSSAIVAFKLGSTPLNKSGFKIIGAHTDSPGLKIKTNSLTKYKNLTKIGIEVYGGPILSTWLDKPLSIAGRITLKSATGMKEKIIDFKKPIAIIPNLAIHLNREVNKGFEYNKQTHLSPIIIIDNDKKDYSLYDLIADQLNIDSTLIMETDLFLYDCQQSSYIGLNDEFISAPKIDNLAMCHGILNSLCNASTPENTIMGIFYDNEEIGSETIQGASSSFIKDLLERIIFANGGNKEDYFRAIASSFQISADGVHAVHPNFADKHDPEYQPEINAGPAIKMNANFRYATTSETAAIFMALCEKAQVPYQKMVNRSDIPSGSTIGPVSSSITGIKTVDVGNPMLAMHSIRELAGAKDHIYMTKVFEVFFG